MRRDPGFTMAEILITLGILALFAGISAVLSVPSIRNAEFDRARETVRNELISAQTDTIGGTFDSSWGVAASTSTLTRYRGSSYALRDPVYDRITALDDSITLGGSTDISFSRPTGLPTAASDITITDGPLHATVRVNAEGVISIQ